MLRSVQSSLLGISWFGNFSVRCWETSVNRIESEQSLLRHVSLNNLKSFLHTSLTVTGRDCIWCFWGFGKGPWGNKVAEASINRIAIS